jgi:hypothetical protein
MLSLIVIAALAYLLTLGGTTDVVLSSRVKDIDAARYLAEAGFQHMRESLRTDGCTGYKSLGDTSFGGGQYAVTVDPKSGSPVTFVATGQTLSGATFSFEQAGVRIFDSPLSTELNPGQSIDDTWLSKQDPWDNFGKSSFMEVTKWSSQRSHAVVRFDVSAIPPGALVKSAMLRLYLESVSVQPPGSGVFVHEVTNDWDEGKSIGVYADGASWNRRDWLVDWNDAGGDYVNSSISFTSLGAGGTQHYLDITPAMQGWVDGTQPNYGVLLTASGGVRAAEFRTGDTSGSPRKPRLLVSYACECGTPGC